MNPSCIFLDCPPAQDHSHQSPFWIILGTYRFSVGDPFHNYYGRLMNPLLNALHSTKQPGGSTKETAGLEKDFGSTRNNGFQRKTILNWRASCKYSPKGQKVQKVSTRVIWNDINEWILYWLVVSTHLKNISQIGNLPQIGMKIKNVWNHHLVSFWKKQAQLGLICRQSSIFKTIL